MTKVNAGDFFKLKKAVDALKFSNYQSNDERDTLYTQLDGIRDTLLSIKSDINTIGDITNGTSLDLTHALNDVQQAFTTVKASFEGANNLFTADPKKRSAVSAAITFINFMLTNDIGAAATITKEI